MRPVCRLADVPLVRIETEVCEVHPQSWAGAGMGARPAASSAVCRASGQCR